MTTRIPDSNAPVVFDRQALANLRARRRTNSYSPLRSVAIVGGTHGNEKTSIYLARHFMIQPEVAKRSSFNTLAMLSNTASMDANSRYTEVDMNRCFLVNDLLDPKPAKLREQARAREINNLLGPKDSDSPATDFIFDLHNTTANTGVALMLAPDDDFAHELGAFLHCCDSTVKICEWTQVENTLTGDWGLLPSISRSGMTFEVGATPWGAVVGAKYDQSRRLLLAALDYIEVHNAVVSKSNSIVRGKKVQAHIHRPSAYVFYPRNEKKEQVGMVHPALQDRDFEEIRDGDPLFLLLDGSTTVFSREKHARQIPTNEALYAFFINEAAYYEGNVALVLATREEMTYGIHDVVPTTPTNSSSTDGSARL
jgi:succinylglutamate desuccinylase